MTMNILKNFSPFLHSIPKCRILSTTPTLLQRQNLHSSALISRQKSHKDCGGYPPMPASGGYKSYKYLFWLVAFPAIAGLSVWNYMQYENNKRCYKRPPFVKRTYMYRRTKRFPWGDGNKSLFHNKEKNALPEGYED